MKISRFVGSFERTVERWERTLSHIAEVIDALLMVQAKWIHLESIFGGVSQPPCSFVCVRGQRISLLLCCSVSAFIS